MLPNGDRLGCLKEAARTVGELFKIHLPISLSIQRRYGVAKWQHKAEPKLRAGPMCLFGGATEAVRKALLVPARYRRREQRMGPQALRALQRRALAPAPASGWGPAYRPGRQLTEAAGQRSQCPPDGRS